MRYQTSSFVALFDACVLYSPGLTSLVIDLARTGLFRAKWTSRIHDEWTRAALETLGESARAKIDKRRTEMDAAIQDCLVEGYEPLESALALPDPHDRHVLAAAISCKASVIVTYNVRDFPESALAPHYVDVQHPDDFLRHAASLDLHAVLEAAQATRRRRKNPPCSAEDFLAEMRNNWQLATTAGVLSEYVGML
ncbi:MAG TPA: PIN domain-containing protein [Vicinamibacterales bacterium]|nr:PIN domain-containing protein [Vicinamibacterales bacterium]